MTHPLRFASVALAALIAPALLGGCAEWDTSRRDLTYAAWKQIDAPVEPRVEKVPVRHVVRFLPGANIMTATDRVTLVGFLAASGIGQGSQVALSVVSPTAEGGARQASRLQAVAATLNQMGVAATAQPPTIAPDVDIAGAQPDDIVVVAYQLAVLPPACPGYNAPVVLDESGRPVSSWGCATAANLGMMVEDPRDLAEGRTLAPADGEEGALVIRRYREGTPVPQTGVETTTSTAGTGG
jgi:pilus assembly protein CpaD